jgi:hypothetical protein
MNLMPQSPVPCWSELESSASQVARQLSVRQLEFSNEQPPPSLFEHLVILCCNASVKKMLLSSMHPTLCALFEFFEYCPTHISLLLSVSRA